MHEASALRRRSDLKKLRELQAKMPRTLQILNVRGDPAWSLRLQIRIPTAKNSNYPSDSQEISEVEIVLPESYPFPPGQDVSFSSPIWNPNVFPSGKWSYGDWKITENMELFVIRLMKVIALDPDIVNPKSPANHDAADWYSQQKKQYPKTFPTVSWPELMSDSFKPKISWHTIK